MVDFNTSKEPNDVRRDMEKNTQHLKDAMKRKNIVKGGKHRFDYEYINTR